MSSKQAIPRSQRMGMEPQTSIKNKDCPYQCKHCDYEGKNCECEKCEFCEECVCTHNSDSHRLDYEAQYLDYLSRHGTQGRQGRKGRQGSNK